MSCLLHVLPAVALVLLLCPYIDNAENTDSLSQDFADSRLRSKRFLDGILDGVVEQFLNQLSTLIGQLSGEAKENFVRKMYVAIKDYASEGKDVFVSKLRLAIEELPGAVSHILDTLVPAFVNLIWSDEGIKPGFVKLRQIIFSEADKMGISGASHGVPGIMTSLVLLIMTQVWRVMTA